MYDLILFGVYGSEVNQKIWDKITRLLEKEFDVNQCSFGLSIKEKDWTYDKSVN